MSIVEDRESSECENKSNSQQQQHPAKLRHDGILEEDGFIMTVEEREYGISSFGTWLQWFAHAGGWSFFISQLLFLILDRGFYVAGDWWLARWADAAYTGMDIGNIHFPPQTDGREAQAKYVTVYVIIVSLSILATMIRSQWAFVGGAQCARKMFDAMTHRVLRAPLTYFETTPLGRVLNRFTYDVEVLDVELSVSMTGLMVSFSWLMASIVVIIAVLPWIMLGIIPVTAVYCVIQFYYRMSGPDLQRIDAVSRSPLQASLAESLEGRTSIRAFQREKRFAMQFRRHVDHNTGAMLNFLAAQRWLGLRIELLGATIGLAVAAIIVCANDVLKIPAGLVGLGIQWSYVFTAALNFFFQRLSESEARITSIERVHETTMLPQEASWETDSSIQLDPAWPTKGELEFDAVCMRYRKELPLALDSVSFKLRPGMRCGVVGRTGSGEVVHDS
jgi:ABC-type multidrug transport system fused ATPase/permease subunit